ncbi:phage terminase large subunit family protein [Methylovulum psychrotolerans]|uniref:terminase gpA endonuclease subunit n=1 Tax=Methylovulum psychrotolerans TaxID=1704499 RepID=UPI001BFF3C15|nr:terminase gpA endonuclease subunit [Methylovulum psychrotolerans]MBT9098409.1 phage terminase large subunit family protein [Methylovulum psychrotolerans]
MRKANTVAHDIAELIRPGLKASVSDNAAKNLKVKGKSGGVGSWDAELVPYMILPMDCLTSRTYEAVIFVGPAQSGKTFALVFGGLAHGIICQKCDMMIVQTTKETATQFERHDLSWTIRNSPELKGQMAAGARSDNVFVKTFKAGNNLFLVWPTVANLSGKAIKFMMMTDYDRMDPIPGEGAVFDLGRKRTETFLSQGMTLAESSPSGEVTDPTWSPSDESPHEAPPSQSQILRLFNDGDRHRFYVECPECKQYFLPPYDDRGLDINISQDLLGVTNNVMTRPAMFVCSANGCLIDTNHKKAMITNGRWLKEGQKIIDGKIVGEGRKSSIASFWFPGIFAAYSNPQKIAQRLLNGLRKYDLEGDEEQLRAIFNVDLGAPYLSRRLVSEFSAVDYQKRAEPTLHKHIPHGVRFIVAVVDVQGWGFSVAVIGYGLHYERWLIDRYEIRVSDRKDGGQVQTMKPAVYLEDWLKIRDEVMAKAYPLDDNSGRTMQLLMTGSDSGGEPGVTERAYDFWRILRRLRLNRKFILLKGERPKPNQQKPKIRKSYPEKTSSKDLKGANAKKEIPIWLVNTTLLKDTLSSDLKKTESSPRYIHFPDWLPKEVFDELTAEVRSDTGGWEKISKRNELWDQLCYAEAVVAAKLVEDKRKELDWDNPPDWAKPWDDNPLIVGTVDAIDAVEPEKIVAEPKAKPVPRFISFNNRDLFD